jgi:hypothetical protein
VVFDPEQGGVYHLLNLVILMKQNISQESAGYEAVTANLTTKLLSFYVGLSQST